MLPPAVPVTFATLHRRMLSHVRDRLANGELTERGLARMVGVSQPHIHNVLKGVRVLTSDVGDLLIGALEVSLLELAESEELGAVLEGRRGGDGASRLVRMARGRISPHERFPDVTEAEDWAKAPAEIISRLGRPVVTGFTPDAEVAAVFGKASHVLLDLDDRARLRLREGCWYAMRWGGAGYVRQLRRESGALVVLGQRAWQSSPLPDRIPLGDLPALAVIRGLVEWYGPDPRMVTAMAQTGFSLPSATFS